MLATFKTFSSMFNRVLFTAYEYLHTFIEDAEKEVSHISPYVCFHHCDSVIDVDHSMDSYCCWCVEEIEAAVKNRIAWLSFNVGLEQRYWLLPIRTHPEEWSRDMPDMNSIYKFQDIWRIFTRVKARTERQIEPIKTFQLCWKVLKRKKKVLFYWKKPAWEYTFLMKFYV